MKIVRITKMGICHEWPTWLYRLFSCGHGDVIGVEDQLPYPHLKEARCRLCGERRNGVVH